MKRGLHYRPASPRGRRRVLAFGMGVLAAMSLMWQQQTTLASWVDAEHGKGTFSADTLNAITPTLTPSYGSVDADWGDDAPTDPWATPQYALDWSANPGGLGSAETYSGTGTNATLSTGNGTQSDTALVFTDVAAGSTHACGIARGRVYCWGTSAAGGLGLGATTATNVPLQVGGLLASVEVVEVSAGTNFSCARTATGSAYCWGEGSSGQLGNSATADATTPRQVSGLGAVTQISAGTVHACAVDSGKAYCWGSSASYQLGNGSNNTRSAPFRVTDTGVLAGRVVSSVSAGAAHSCAVADGRAFCWGNNGSGRLGNTSAITATTPVAVTTSGVLLGRTVTVVSAGNTHSCAVADGEAFCWGDGANGRLGRSSTTGSTSPVAVTTSTMSGTVTTISAASAHTCAVANATAYCWGLGTSGQLGNNASTTSTSPVQVTGALSAGSAQEISGGTNFSCATGGSAAACWGLGTSGQIGDGSSVTRPQSTAVSLTEGACPAGSVRRGSSCSLVEGTGYYFRLGYSIGSWIAPNSNWISAITKTRTGVNPSLASRTSTSITLQWPQPSEPGDSYAEYTLQRSTSASGSNPKTIAVVGSQSATDRGGVAPPGEFAAMSAGYYHTCGIVDGDLYCWGRNNYGQLGVGGNADLSAPTRVPFFDGMTVTDVSAGYYHTCAIADGVGYCWGYNGYGQLGTGDTATSYTPVAVANQGSLVAETISAGQYHSCAITEDGNAWCWGRNNYGQLGVGNTTSSAAYYYPQAVLAGGMGVGVATDITAGYSHTCATANSRAYCWGSSSYGQIGSWGADSTTPKAVDTSYAMGTHAVTSLSAGQEHTCAIADSRAYCWGRNNYGQLGYSSGTTYTYNTQAVTTSTMSGSVTAISAGVSSACAVANSKAYCWGYGTSGQLGNSAILSSTFPVAVPASGPLGSATASVMAGGYQHSCGAFDGRLYCWGAGNYGRLGNRSTASYSYPQAAPLDSVCDGGTDLGDGTCTLAPGTTYYYRVKYTLDGGSSRTGSWVGVSTS